MQNNSVEQRLISSFESQEFGTKQKQGEMINHILTLKGFQKSGCIFEIPIIWHASSHSSLVAS